MLVDVLPNGTVPMAVLYGIPFKNVFIVIWEPSVSSLMQGYVWAVPRKCASKLMVSLVVVL